MKIEKRILVLAACGLVGGVATVANAQPRVINISGATLLENFCKVPSSTNDFIDVDGDGVAGSLGSGSIDQLAPFQIDPFGPTEYFAVQYRAPGSVNGLNELTLYGSTFVTSGPTGEIKTSLASNAYFNGNRYIAAGAATGIANNGNPGSAPVTSDTSTLTALRTIDGSFSGGGIRIDISPVDVSSAWATQRSGAATDPFAGPAVTGYGQYARTSVKNDGSAGGMTNSLPGLNGRNLNVSSPDANTLFDTPLSLAPIALMVNYGVGRQQIDMDDIQWLYTTGRVRSGENLMAVTRDAGSGTRNAFNNTTGTDPSWGTGENVGGLLGAPSNSENEDRVGPRFVPGNKNGGSNLIRTVRNHRLAMGYAGGETGATGSYPGSWLTTDAAETLAVVHNVGSYAGSTAYRINAFNVLEGNYNIGGPAVLITIGDPRNQNELGGSVGNTNPRMRNPYAAAYVNNITRSVESFVAGVGNPDNDFMPGQYLATQFVLTAGLKKVHNQLNPTQMDSNPAFTPALYSYALANNILANPRFDTFNTNSAGKSPRRFVLSSGTYSDGRTDSTFVANDGTLSASDSTLNLRNKVAGDFDGDGARTTGDVTEMVRALKARETSTTWAAPDGIYAAGSGAKAIIEILGDFNGDGSFTKEDLRYWADGLHLVAGNLDRKAGFTAIDNASLAVRGTLNLLGTTKVTGFAYAAGDSRADVARSNGNVARGYAPVGADGVIDRFDLRYIRDQFIGNVAVTDGQANWDNELEATSMDLSCDLTGDLKVNAADVEELYTILGTCPADFDLDGTVDFFDYDSFVVAFEAGTQDADFDGDGTSDFFDYDAFVVAFELGC